MKRVLAADFSLLAQSLRQRVTFDGQIIYEPDIVAAYR